jgi:formylglycine-generating enzyme required for sulfatase activity
MAPELWAGKEADVSTDLYALICSYFHLLTGRAPYEAPSLPALGYLHRYEPFPDPRSHLPRLPEAVCRILARGAQKEQAERYASAVELLKDLDRLLASSPELSSEESWQVDLDGDLGSLVEASETQSIALKTKVASTTALRTAVAPPWYRRPRTWAIAAGAALPLLLLAVVVHVTTNYGTIKIELSDPAATVDVQVDGNTIDIGGLKEPLRIKSGPHDLTVTSGDFQTVTKSFEVKRGSVEIVKVSLLPKTPAVAIAKIGATGKSSSSRTDEGKSSAANANNSEQPPPATIAAAKSPTSPTQSIASNVAAKSSIDEKPTALPVAPQIETPQHKAGTTWTNSVGMTFAFIPAGQHIGDWPDATVVALSHAYMIQSTEVTQAQWSAVMGFNPSRFKGADLPVHGVSWNDSVEFCRKLGEREKRRYRLPTVTEWRYASKADTFAANDLDDIGAKAWYGENSDNKIHPVAKKQPNAWGLYDLRGNVYEWCADWWEPPYKREGVDPTGPAEGKTKALAGGAFDCKVGQCVNWWVGGGGPPTGRGHMYGFRPLLVLENGELPRPPAPEFQKLVRKLGDTWTSSLGMKFAYIAPGEFFMGSPANEQYRGSAETLHRVRITKPFLLGIHEVTRGQFAAFVQETGYKTEAEKPNGAAVSGPEHMGPIVPGANWRQPGFAQGENHPVVCVSWNAAMTYANWLSRKEGIICRLPTEAEWEYSCRAGTKTTFHWGADANRGKSFANCADQSTVREYKQIKASFWDDGFPFTSSVGSFKPNAWGLFDMSGNASEWTSDFGGDLPAEMQVDPQGPGQSVSPVPPNCHVFRGGSWGTPSAECRSACRGMFYGGPEYSGTGVGFRLVVELPKDVQAASPLPQPVTAADEAAADPEFAKSLSKAEGGNRDAMWDVGRHFLDKKDYVEAVKWWRKGADAGQANCMRDLGFAYDRGWAVTADDVEAFQWLMRGAENGDTLAMLVVASHYELGKGVKQNYAAALKWYKKAADFGNAAGVYGLASMYENGRGVSKNLVRAFEWRRKAVVIDAADAKSTPAGFQKMARMYDEGIGTSKNPKEAMKWYQMAADKGSTSAMRSIGDLYDAGRGVAKDADQAATWYRKAAAAGDKKASEWLTSHKLSP